MYKIHMTNATKYSIPKREGKKNHKFMFLKEYVKLYYCNVKSNEELVKKNRRGIVLSNYFLRQGLSKH